MRAIILTIFILGTLNLFGQIESTGLILTQEQNEDWFLHLGQSTLKDKIKLINKRILSDTNVFVPNKTDRYIAENLNGRLSGYCKPVIVAGGIPIYIENKAETSDVKRLTELLNSSVIKSIEIISGEKAIAIYGSRGECKVLVVTILKKSTIRKLEKLDEKMNPPKVTREIRWRH